MTVGYGQSLVSLVKRKVKTNLDLLREFEQHGQEHGRRGRVAGHLCQARGQQLDNDQQEEVVQVREASQLAAQPGGQA